MDFWDLLIWAGSIGFIVCLMPQVWRTLHLRRADDISLGFLLLVLASSGFTLPYMLHAGEHVFAVAQGVNLLVWGTVLYFRLFPGPRPSTA